MAISGFSEHFSFEELTDSSHKELVAKNRNEAMEYLIAGKRLSKLLESIRTYFGSSITVSSGFRGPEVNTAVESKAKSSAHLRFEAADIIPSGISVEAAFDKLRADKAKFGDLRKVILEKVGSKKWLHVEVKMSASEPQKFYLTTDGSTYKEVV